MQACFVFGAGPFYGLAASPAPGDVVLAADGGLRHCRAAGLRPDLLLGDFDSLDHLPEGIPHRRFPVDKDDTDTVLALKTGLEMGCGIFHLYGCTGGRMDHTLANLQALAFLARKGARGFLYDESFVFTAVTDGRLVLPARAEGIFSVFALAGEARGVTIRGGRYPLNDGVLSPWFPLGVSNHFQGEEVEIAVTDGCVTVGWELPASGS